MPGDQKPGDGSLRKGQGLICDTAKDQLRIDVKLKMSSKMSCVKIEPDRDLDANMHDAVPKKITMRVLWRVCQGKYDLLGLLNMCITRHNSCITLQKIAVF